MSRGGGRRDAGPGQSAIIGADPASNSGLNEHGLNQDRHFAQLDVHNLATESNNRRKYRPDRAVMPMGLTAAT